LCRIRVFCGAKDHFAASNLVKFEYLLARMSR